MFKNLRILTVSALGFLLITMNIVTPVQASITTSPTGSSDSIGVGGKVDSNPPTQAPTITIPSPGTTTNNNIADVRGLCPNGIYVKIFKNSIFAGSAVCTNGTYQLQIDLFFGRNDLVAIAYDALDQATPESNKTDITYQVTNPQDTNYLTLTTPYARRGFNPKTEISWPFTIIGGVGPYAVSVDFGDGTSPELVTRDKSGEFFTNHQYQKAGLYIIFVRTTDSRNATTFMQVIAVVNGQSVEALADVPASEPPPLGSNLAKYVFWPALVVVPFIVSTFWLGRHHELYMLKKNLEMGEKLAENYLKNDKFKNKK